VDRFDNMRVFAKVVESGSFTGAANAFQDLSVEVEITADQAGELNAGGGNE